MTHDSASEEWRETTCENCGESFEYNHANFSDRPAPRLCIECWRPKNPTFPELDGTYSYRS